MVGLRSSEFIEFRTTSGVTRGLSLEGNFAERGPLVAVEGPLQPKLRKYLRNGKSGCAWLYKNSKSTENTQTQKQRTENQKNTKTEI